MFRFLLNQLRHRRGRTATLGVGILVAAVSFTLLTAAVSTSQLRVIGAVRKHFRPAYDILVRPRDSFTEVERREGLVQGNYLSGIFGGITFEQYRAIKDVASVEVAAPIANIGYILPFQEVPIAIDRFLSDDPTQMYRLRIEWMANRGLSQYPDSPHYIYFTRRNRFVKTDDGLVSEVLPGGRRVPACIPFVRSLSGKLLPSNPFSIAYGTGMTCFSDRSPGLQWPVLDQGPLPHGQVGTYAFVHYPMFLAAIDPAQELRLVGLEGAVVNGHVLRRADGVRLERVRGLGFRTVPILVSTRTYLDETLRVTVERLDLPPEPLLHLGLSSDQQAFGFVSHLSGQEVGTISIPADRIYQSYLKTLGAPKANRRITYDGYWTGAAVDYRLQIGDRLTPITTRNPASAFRSNYGSGWAPWENRDVQFRQLGSHRGSTSIAGSVFAQPSVRVIGQFDPELLPGFSALSEVPLETYYPPAVLPADAASERALGGGPLLPTMNLGGYVSQPPLMLTNLRGLRAFMDSQAFEDTNAAAPISVIRVRVAGVTGPDPVSRERIRLVAEMIHKRTGLAVDITAGSSPRPMLVELPQGKFGQPPLLVREGWVEKGVALRFLEAVDRKSLALFVLILAVCGLFLANGAFASVRARRGEIGTLLCLGWSRSAIFRAVLGELVLIGLVAGVAGTGLALLLVTTLSLDMPLLQALLVTPIAVALALAAGFLPAVRASGAVPLDAVRPSVAGRSSRGMVRRVIGMARANLRRLPSRTLIGALGLFVGVAALTVILAINLAFQGVLVGTLLGGFVSVQVRGVDLASVLLAILLGGFSVADVLFLNLRERAPEFVTLRASGWGERDLGRLVAWEGAAMGVLGAVPGAAVGIALAGVVGGLSPEVGVAGLLAAGAGVLVALTASLVPATLIGRMSPPSVLAEE